MLDLRPILSAMTRNKAGATLIALQMAVTLAILCNALFVVRQRLARTARPTGLDEANLFAVSNQWLADPPDLPARVRADLDALRAIPGVLDAYASNVQPLSDNAFNTGITLDPQGGRGVQLAAVYFGDEHAVHTLGVKLSAGHGFSAADVSDCSQAVLPQPGGILVTRALAGRLARGGRVLGRTVTVLMGARISVPIIGIINRLQAPAASEYGGSGAVEDSILWPCRDVSTSSVYIVRTRPGGLDAAMKAAPGALAALSRERVIQSVQSLRTARRDVYRGDRGLARMLIMICAILIVVTAAGIFGLTSYWVTQRRHQIGIRRALGATRTAVMRHFQAENFLLAAAGVLIGVALAVAANMLLATRLAMPRVPAVYLAGGAVAVLLLGQLAVLWPALRAAAVPPAVATRAL